MQSYSSLSKNEKQALYTSLTEKYNEYCSSGLKLDISRGKPNSDQLDVAQELLSYPITAEETKIAGVDARNYGIIDGIPEAKKLFADIMGVDAKNVFVGGNSSLQLMYDTLSRAMLFGTVDSERPWCKEEGLKWICVVPGYDRHFKITEVLGFELISVKMTETGPDMDEIERLVKDERVKGMWCVPKYSNPTGNTYSDETVRRLAKMQCAAKDFRIMWDNAYVVHDLYEEGDKLLNIFEEAEKCGNANRVIGFTSTSKITFPGAGVAAIVASSENLAEMKRNVGVQTIGYDKINQLRHVAYLKDAQNVHRHMMNLAQLLRSKFEITLKALSELDGLEIAQWSVPNGGYFISLDVMKGCAKRVFELMRNAGVTLTEVGATFPYGVDPDDTNLRLAPSYPTDEELALACEILVVAVKMAALEKLM